ncbi:hypothetical protein DUNSADRAFT_14633 [Dunaliella salina]|uniref:Uncharacterized protein n=1 Tax=Dunaliella salina TaxID=3046 RepID=A0ABQ7G727_DUNSA|nr:hypothetical protein DUNSADRAFT_14633 [Dunaliella salina]|eukprot:KAF5830412.1 hypothetical protein DUNSADRAFT_14633 [Dunaliella salina]
MSRVHPSRGLALSCFRAAGPCSHSSPLHPHAVLSVYSRSWELGRLPSGELFCFLVMGEELFCFLVADVKLFGLLFAGEEQLVFLLAGEELFLFVIPCYCKLQLAPLLALQPHFLVPVTSQPSYPTACPSSCCSSSLTAHFLLPLPSFSFTAYWCSSMSLFLPPLFPYSPTSWCLLPRSLAIQQLAPFLAVPPLLQPTSCCPFLPFPSQLIGAAACPSSCCHSSLTARFSLPLFPHSLLVQQLAPLLAATLPLQPGSHCPFFLTAYWCSSLPFFLLLLFFAAPSTAAPITSQHSYPTAYSSSPTATLLCTSLPLQPS